MNATELLDSLPEKWRRVPLKSVCNYTVSNVDKHSFEDELPVRLCNYTDVYKNDRVSPELDLMIATATEDEIERFHLEVGDVVITKDSESWDDIGSLRRKEELLAILTAEQFGLCGYTGAPVDERISELESLSGGASFRNQIEHVKSQDACKRELVRRGGEYGRDLCDDLNYYNMIAAVEVRGSEPEHFGAVKKKNRNLPVLPTQEGCDECFKFYEGDGSIPGIDYAARASISILDLDHKTLKKWRKSAIDVWLDPEIIHSREDLKAVQQAMEQPVGDKLPEYAFVVSSIVREYLR